MKRLVTWVDIADPAAEQVLVSARHELELADGSRVLLLGDRGWGASASWSAMSEQEVRETSQMVVGPDEPFDDRTQQDMQADHWASLQQVAQRRGVAIDAEELRQLPHEVVLSSRLLRRMSGEPPGSDVG